LWHFCSNCNGWSITKSVCRKRSFTGTKGKKTIIPCFHKDIIDSNIKWGLDKIQGVEFDDKYELARIIRYKIANKGGIFGSSSKTVEVTNAPDPLIKSDIDRVPHFIKKGKQKKDNKHILVTKSKIIVIPLIALAIIIGVIVSVSYFKIETITPSNTTKTITPSNTTKTITPSNTTKTITPSNTTKTYQFIKDWGGLGVGDGDFKSPSGVSIDSSTGNVYVADTNNHRIQKFDSNGNFLTKWGKGTTNVVNGIAVDSTSDIVYVDMSLDNGGLIAPRGGDKRVPGGVGDAGDGEFSYPTGIALDSSANVYVVDSGNDRIQKFDSNGNFLLKWGIKGYDDGQFDHPAGISIDSSDNVYVADAGKIQKFDSEGNFITKWGTIGNGDGQINSALGISIDSSDLVYVVDTNNNRIQVFAPATKWSFERTKT